MRYIGPAVEKGIEPEKSFLGLQNNDSTGPEKDSPGGDLPTKARSRSSSTCGDLASSRFEILPTQI
ncbi:hypothetical protein PanWU01x14_058040 [Parasponia andersonii]|uniref:Uncharacterized protein n=1 Tax=Parasponia andersonii TaxID=3476 RepID=A0A2P5DJ57_PARAD|nr:hypothetical protein PanWU01x14_058040 [Parasponia andersonii]